MSTKEARIQNFRIIGAGVGRTGTSSLRDALNILGFGPCYHMEEVIKQSELWIWNSVEDLLAQGKQIEWDEVFGYKKFQPYRSCVDFPASLYYAELMEYYPNSKVILTVREPEKWYDSFYETICLLSPFHPEYLWITYIVSWPSPMAYIFGLLAKPRMKKFLGVDAIARKEAAIEAFNDWNEKVQSMIPEKKLLIFQPHMGWDPLCKFLDVPVPDQPFPNSNDRAT